MVTDASDDGSVWSVTGGTVDGVVDDGGDGGTV